jgi:hypothetical protein
MAEQADVRSGIQPEGAAEGFWLLAQLAIITRIG